MWNISTNVIRKRKIKFITQAVFVLFNKKMYENDITDRFKTNKSGIDILESILYKL